MKKIKLDQAKKVAEEIIKAAKEDRGDPIAITIAGEGGIPIVTLAMDDVMPGSVNLSMKKPILHGSRKTKRLSGKNKR